LLDVQHSKGLVWR